jgi:hypothetical protein
MASYCKLSLKRKNDQRNNVCDENGGDYDYHYPDLCFTQTQYPMLPASNTEDQQKRVVDATPKDVLDSVLSIDQMNDDEDDRVLNRSFLTEKLRLFCVMHTRPATADRGRLYDVLKFIDERMTSQLSEIRQLEQDLQNKRQRLSIHSQVYDIFAQHVEYGRRNLSSSSSSSASSVSSVAAQICSDALSPLQFL